MCAYVAAVLSPPVKPQLRSATVGLIRQLGGEIVAAAFLIELDALNGRANLDGYPIISLMHL